jgi:Leucine-rich repeat (LRR) protein
MQCREDESYALLQFKEGFDINKLASMNPLSYPKTTSWNASKDCCSWDGIKCDKHTNRVIHVDLRSSQLYGKMDANSSLFHLEHLRNLDLSDNNFDYSQIPHTIGELSQLRYLNLSHTMFFGEIPPQISHLSKLLSLDLGLNIDVSSPSPRSSAVNLLKLESSILRSIIQNSTKLETLQLSYVTISSTLPDTLTNLTSLQALSLYSSELHGEFPVGVFHLPKLKYLDLRYNHNLNGKLPEFQSSSLAQLELDDTGFYGTLPSSIGKLSSLKKLSISGCHFYGNIPSSLGNLTQLVYISLEYNKFRGDPSASLENRTKISELYVGYNEFTIETISWIGKFSSLIGLDISSINVGSEIPLFVANLTKLQYLSAQKSNMKGEIPSWIMNLTNLAYLNLAQNSLHGEIPNSLFRLENLERLSLCDNLLHGKVELDMFLKFKKLSVLNLSFNKFSLLDGKSSSNVTKSRIRVLQLASCNLVKIPTFIRDLNDLECLLLSNNSITTVPDWLWRKESLISFTISYNSLIGEIYSSICNLKSLVRLDLSFNNLSGNVPSCLGNFSQHLEILMLKGNKLSGLIPQTYLMGNSLQMIDFSKNNLQGRLPRTLVNCKWLEYFDIRHNNINDSFPFWLGDLPELKVLDLSNNEFYGDIECYGNNTCTFPKLHIIDLSHNEFSGNFPTEMIRRWKAMKTSNTSQLQYEQEAFYFQSLNYKGYWTETDPYSFTISNKGLVMVYNRLQEFFNMIAIDFSSNKINGEIPHIIGDLKGLVSLNLSNNFLIGNIPSSLSKLSNLESLDLSLNKLSGKIPQQLTQLTFLEFFNVSFNNLSGNIPQNKQFATFLDNSFEGNKGLCGDQLSHKCLDHTRPSFSSSSADDDDDDSGFLFELDWKVVLIGYGSGFVVGVLGSTFYHKVIGWLKRVF